MRKFIERAGHSKKFIFSCFATYCILLYVLLALFFLKAAYVEGDDARTILYHVMGRDKTVQQPYAPYQSGFDFLLSFVRQDEALLRKTAVFTSFVSGGLVLLLSGVLIISLEDNTRHLLRYLMLIPVMIPEFLFNSAYSNPTNIGFTFALCAAIALVQFIHKNKSWYLVCYAVLFGLAVPFRWSLVYMVPAYGGIFLYQTKLKPSNRQLVYVGVATCMAVAAAFAGIILTGYSVNDMLTTFRWAQNLIDNNENHFITQAINAASYYTIPLLICLVAAFAFLRKNKSYLLKTSALALVSIVPYFTLMFQSNFKFSITYMPVILLLGYHGFRYLQSTPAARMALYVSCLFMWFSGIQVHASNVAYGPGFEKRKATYLQSGTSVDVTQRVKTTKVNITCNGGLLMPTTEGPRPLYGYFYVILGGEWKHYHTSAEQERLQFINAAKKKHLMTFLDSKTATLQCDLYQQGYQAKQYQKNEDDDFFFRTFTKGNDTLSIHIIPNVHNKSQWIIRYQKKINQPVLLHSKYTSLISDIAARHKKSVMLSAYSVLIR